MTIVHGVYSDHQENWEQCTQNKHDILHWSGQLFESVAPSPSQQQMISVRDDIRNELGKTKPDLGLTGTQGIDLYELSRTILCSSQEVVELRTICPRCKHVDNTEASNDVVWTLTSKQWTNHTKKLGLRRHKPISEWLQAAASQKSNRVCTQCDHRLHIEQYYTSPPLFNVHSSNCS